MSSILLSRVWWPGWIFILSVALIVLIIVFTIIRVSLKSKRRHEEQHRKDR